MSDTFDAAAHAAGENAAAAVEQDSSAPAETVATQAETTEAPATSEQTEDASQDDAAGTPSRSEKRIQQLLQRDRENRERIAYLEGLAQRNPAPEQSKPEQQAPRLAPDLAQWVGDEPKPDTFPAGEFDPQYLRAIARFEARSEQAGMVQAQRLHAARQAEQARSQAFFEQVEKAAAEYTDIREVVGTFGQTVPNWAANLVADAGADVAYAIAKDAEAAGRIRSARDAIAVAREIGRIEARLERAKDTPSPQPTSAPDPAPRTVRGGNIGTVDPSKMSMEQYAKWSKANMPPVV